MIALCDEHIGHDWISRTYLIIYDMINLCIMHQSKQEEFEDTKVVIRIRKSKKN